MIFSKNINDLTDTKFYKINKLTKHTKDITGQKFGNLTVIEPLMAKRKGTNETVWWICKCTCGNYYRVLPNKLTRNISKCCPECNKNINIHSSTGNLYPKNNTATKTDEEIVNMISDKFYYLYEKYMDLEDFKQELNIIIYLNKINKDRVNKSRTFAMEVRLKALLNTLKYQYNTKTKWEIIPLIEDMQYEIYYDNLDYYPLTAKLKKYYDKYLTEQEKIILTYYYKYELSIIHISDILKISKQRVYQVQMKALEKLKIKLEGGKLRQDEDKYIRTKFKRIKKER